MCHVIQSYKAIQNNNYNDNNSSVKKNRQVHMCNYQGK